MNAPRIYQDYLDRVSSRMWDEDADGVAAMMTYPHVVHLPRADRIIDCAAAQERDVRAFRDELRAMGATAFHRLCRTAAVDPSCVDRIVGRHTTYVMAGGGYLLPPYECEMSLRRDATDGWRSDAIRLCGDGSGLDYHREDLRPSRNDPANGA